MRKIYNSTQDAKATTNLTLGKYSAALAQCLIIALIGLVFAAIIYMIGVDLLYCGIAFLVIVIFAAVVLILDIRAVEARDIEIDDKLIKEEQRQNTHLRAMDIAKQESETTLELARIQEREGAQRILLAIAKVNPELAANITATLRLNAGESDNVPKLEGRQVRAQLTGGILSPVFNYEKMRDMLVSQAQFGTSRAVKTVDGQTRTYTHDNNIETELKQIALKMQRSPLVKDGNVYKILPGNDVKSVVAWLDAQVFDV